MNNMPWLRTYVNMFADERIAELDADPKGDSYICIWMKLLCLAGKVGFGGKLLVTEDKPYTPEMMAKYFRRKPSLVKKSLGIFLEMKLISLENETYLINDWSRYQGSDKEAERREKNRVYKEKSRERAKLNVSGQGADSQQLEERVEDVRLEETRVEEERIEDHTITYTPPPTLEDVKNFCKERGSTISPLRFFQWYSEKGWYKNGKLIDWQKKVALWETREKFDERKANYTQPVTYDRSQDDDSELYFRNKKLNKEDAS